MSKEVKLTVLCICYNHENYIRQTLESILNQKTSFKFRVIVHDDASTDSTPKIIQQYAERYSDILFPILQKRNQYSKIGIKQIFEHFIQPNIVGEYIAFCEGDDYWNDMNKLQKQVEFLESNQDYIACVHNSYLLNVQRNSKQLFNTKDKEPIDIQVEDVISGIFGCFHISSLVCRANKIDFSKEYFDILEGILDYPIIVTLAMQGRIRYVPTIMSTYRYLSGDFSWTSKSVRKKNNIEEANRNDEQRIVLLNMLETMYPKYIDIIETEIIRKQYMKLERNGDWIRIFRNSQYLKIFLQKSFIEKCKILLKYSYYGIIRK